MEQIENTLSKYLGPEFQQHLMWQLLVEPEFAVRTLPRLSAMYFDDPTMKRLFIIMTNYLNEFAKPPNLQNDSIILAINKFKTPNNLIEEELLFAIVKRILNWNDRVINRNIDHNGEAIQLETTFFIKQQEYRKLGEFIINMTKNGDIRQKQALVNIEDKIRNIAEIGDVEDYGTEAMDDIDNVLSKEFREVIPTGVVVLDALTGGGLGKGEIGLVLTPSGVGKSTLLTKIASTGYAEGKKVLQIIFEDTEAQIKRKHYAIWSGVPLSEMDERSEEVKQKCYEFVKDKRDGKIVIKRMSQENTTMNDVKNFISRYEKKNGIKFELLVLDYLDCLEPNKKSADRTEAELQIVKSFLALSADLDIPAWSAIQSSRAGLDSEFVEASQAGGSIKRLQKAHFFMSVAKPPASKDANLANIRIIKARFAKDGQTFKDCIFDNDKMQIVINDEDYMYKYSRSLKVSDSSIDRFNKKLEGTTFEGESQRGNDFEHNEFIDALDKTPVIMHLIDNVVPDEFAELDKITPDITFIEPEPIDNDPVDRSIVNEIHATICQTIDFDSLGDPESDNRNKDIINLLLADREKQNIIKNIDPTNV
jgi:archaellum biogenesis ATPase FlaH